MVSEAAVRVAIAEHLGVPSEQVVDEAAFRTLGADSLDLIELTLLLEQQFDVQIPDDDAHRCSTVGEAVALVRAARSAAASTLVVRTAVGA
jgi:acyl carrier protein